MEALRRHFGNGLAVNEFAGNVSLGKGQEVLKGEVALVGRFLRCLDHGLSQRKVCDSI